MTTSALVPRSFPVAIDGTPFMLDMLTTYGVQKFVGPVTIPVTRTQSDSSVTPGAGSLDRDDAWRTVFTDWSHGAGQTWYDDPTSDAARFRASKGVDPWTVGQLSLLNTTSNLQSASTAYSYIAIYPSIVGDSISPKIALYYLDTITGTATFRRLLVDSADALTGPTSITGMTSTHGGTATKRPLVHAGASVCFVDGGTGIRVINNGGTATGPFATVSALTGIDGIGFAKNRILAWGGSGFLVCDVTAGGTISTPTFSLSGNQGGIVDVSEGSSVIYISANLDGRAVIYSVAADATSTALTNIKRAGVLPVGETVYSTFGYSGLLFVGTNLGFRTCIELSDGTLQIGALVNIGKPVRCFNAIGQFVYFGWSNYDGSDGGLGRIDPTTFTNPASIIPAYATDIMAASNTNNVLDITVFDNGAGTYKPYFITSDKLWRQTSTALASGTIDTGFTTYGLTDPKCAVGVEVRTEALPSSSVQASLTNVHGGSPSSISTYSTTSGTGTYMTVSNIVGSEHEIRLTLAASGSPPVVTATTLFAQVRSATRGEMWQVPVLIGTDIDDLNGNSQKFDPYTVIASLRALVASASPVTVQFGTYSDTMFVESIEFHGFNWLMEGAPAGTAIVTLKNLAP